MTDDKKDVDDDDGEGKFQDSKADDGFFRRTVSVKHDVIDVYLTETVKQGSFYTKLEYALRLLKPKDKVNFILGSYGGFVDGFTHLVSAIDDCRAREINMKVVRDCYSCGAMLALCGTSLEMKKHTKLMFHNYSGGEVGKGAELIMAVKEGDKGLRVLFNDVCSPFLTPEELKKIENDKDVYVHWNSRGLKGRIKRHFGRKRQ